MKLVTLGIISWIFSSFGYKAMAQEARQDTAKKKESQEIIIRKSGDKDAKITVEISGDNVTINGKPLMEFKDDAITINKRKIFVKEGKGLRMTDDFDFDFDMDNFKWNSTPRTFLGVTTEKTEKGVVIKEVTKDSPAEKAGLQKDDVITKLEDTKISTPQELYDAIVKRKAGDVVKVAYNRGNKDKSVKATLAEKKDSGMTFSMTGPDGKHKVITVPPATAFRSFPRTPGNLEELEKMDFENFGGNNYSFNWPRQQKLGLRIQDLEEGEGVKVMDVEENSGAEKAGLKEDDIITEIAGKKIANTDDARKSLQENKDKASYNVKAKRGGKEMSFDIKIPKKLKTTNL